MKSLEEERDYCEARIKEADKPVDIDKLGDMMERVKDEVLRVLKSKQSDTDTLRTALSLFIQSITLTEQGAVIIRHTLPGYAEVVSKNSGDVSAPPGGVEPSTS